MFIADSTVYRKEYGAPVVEGHIHLTVAVQIELMWAYIQCSVV